MELYESISMMRLTGRPISELAVFEEFRLDLTVRYRGRPLDFNPRQVDPMSLLDEDAPLPALSSMLVQRLADDIKIKQNGEECERSARFQH